jgi:hypothetical protein
MASSHIDIDISPFTINFDRGDKESCCDSTMFFVPCFSDEKRDYARRRVILKQEKMDKIVSIVEKNDELDDNKYDIKVSPTYMFLAIHKKMWDIMEAYRPTTILINIIYHEIYFADSESINVTHNVYTKSRIIKLKDYRSILDGLTEAFG